MKKAKPKTKSAKKNKVHKVMKEFKEGTLKSGKGGKALSRAQAMAIAMKQSGQSRRPEAR
jgi:hypothetical protein